MRSLEPGDDAPSVAEVLDALPIIAFVAAPDGTIRFISAAFSTVTGIARDEVSDDRYIAFVFPDDREPLVAAWQRALFARTPSRSEYRFRFADGSYHWMLSQAEPVRDADGSVTSWFGTTTIIDDRKRAELGLRLLSATGAAAVRSIDYRETLRNLVDALVEEFASYSIMDIDDGTHPWERFATHRDPARVARLVALSRPAPEHPIAQAFAGTEARAIPIDDAWLAAVHAADDRISLIHDYRVRSVIIAPVRSPNNRIIGALTVGLDDVERTGNTYREADVPYVEEVARRAGAAITNARLFEQQRRIAVELQATSLPRSLPSVPHVVFDAFYRPGSDEATIGGDWYDALALDDGRIVLTVGDVRGHGLEAAIVMTKLRQAIQSAAMVDASPAVMLTVADRTMRLTDPDAFATAIAAVYDPATGELTVASAGHPPPLLVDAMQVDEIVARGPVLGLGEHVYEVAHRRIGADARLVLYTDGLTEAERDLERGYLRLLDAVRAIPSDAPSPAEMLVRLALGTRAASDDIAVLVATISAPTR